MRVLIQMPAAPRHATVATGWASAFQTAGHEVSGWEPQQFPALDAFAESRPQLFIETRPRTRAVDKGLVRWAPRVVDRKWFLPVFDTHRFAKVVGGYRGELACDLCFVGDYREKKRPLLDAMIRPLLDRYRVKLFGPTPWGVPQYLGTLSDQELADLYHSARVVLNVSEQRPGERLFQATALGGCLATNVSINGDPCNFETFEKMIQVALNLNDEQRKTQISIHSLHVRKYYTYDRQVSDILRDKS
jgi:hypothetical protein